MRGLILSLCRRLSSAGNKELILERLQGAEEGIALVTMNRPHVKNALGRNFINEFTAVIEEIKHDKQLRSLIVRSSTPGAFCVGADLKERKEMTPHEVTVFLTKARRLINDLDALPFPTIAAIDGYALGGGLELALACDMRVVGMTAKVGLIETTIAVIPGIGGTQRLPRLIGPGLAKELIFTGRMIDGLTAAKIGLANRVAEDAKVYDAALDLAREIVSQGPVALRMAKQAISKGMEVDLSTGLFIEEACYAQVIPTKDRLEALRAFQEKRKPNFVGE